MPLTRDVRAADSPRPRSAEGEPLGEYWALVDGVALWDVGHQHQVEVVGPDAMALVQHLVPRDLSGHEVGQSKYALVTNHDGGIVCDPVILRLDEQRFWLGAAGHHLYDWCERHARSQGFRVDVGAPAAATVQLQGPLAAAVMEDLLGDDVRTLGYHRVVRREVGDIGLVVSRTGWGGIDGFEISVLAAHADDDARARRWWDVVLRAGERHEIVAAPPNHAHRIEAGLPLFGRDIDAQTNPLEMGIGWEWMVDLDQPDDFVGKDALVEIRRAGAARRLVRVEIGGAPLTDFGADLLGPVLVLDRDGTDIGHLTSACWSPRRRRNLGLAMVGVGCADPGAVAGVDHPDHGRLMVTVRDDQVAE